MIQPGSMEKRSVSMKILDADQIWEIRRAAVDVMFHAGFKVLHAGARKMLKQAGAVVKDELVKVPEFVVEQCLQTAPKQGCVGVRCTHPNL